MGERHKRIVRYLRLLLVLCITSAVGLKALNGASSAVRPSDDFDSESPMEIQAGTAEVENLLAQYPNESYLLFPQDRKYPIRMNDALPLRWVKNGPQTKFIGQAQPGEYYTFQIGLFAAQKDITDISVSYSNLKGEDGNVIHSSRFCCFNLGGIDWQGRKITRPLSITKGMVQALWFGVSIPKDAVGRYEGILTVQPENAKPAKIKLTLEVAGAVLEDAGDSELWRHSRLRWLNSTIKLNDDVTKPFVPMQVDGRTIHCLGRELTIADTGLPLDIISRFAPTVDRIGPDRRSILAEPVSLIIEQADQTIEWSGGKPIITSHKPGHVEWQSEGTKGIWSLKCLARMEFDGYVFYRLELEAHRQMRIKDIRLKIPFRSDAARYMMGMGRKGGRRTEKLDWKWNRDKNQDSLWIGDVNAGLRCRLRGPNYSRPLVNIYYKYKPLNLPRAWYNQGRGGCKVDESGSDRIVLTAYSGERIVKAGEKLHFHFDLLITPFKPIDVKSHWAERYFHGKYRGRVNSAEEIARKGANIINIHHGNDLNPYINYPFHRESVKALKQYIKSAHKNGLKAKIYYTVRELTNHIVELWALRSLGDEILATGVGNKVRTVINPKGADPWLRKHLRTNYIPAWRHVFREGKYKGCVDASILTSGMSRWHNYYLEGLNWLIENVEIDGLYIDDVAYDRVVMQRVRKILDSNRPGSLIDMHSWNHFNKRAGWTNCANLYMEHFPYLNRIWFGEMFDYNERPDYWLIEISGIPYGLMGEMLQGGGNPWRGMLYGMTSRLPWSGNPRGLWKFWDEFGIEKADMIGYWVPSCPVKTNKKDVPATVYKRKGKTLISLASWAEQPIECRLIIDWNALGLDEKKVRVYAPAIPKFQEESVFSPNDTITVPGAKGYLLIVK